MLANYHTHTPLCRHAVGEMREYIEAAIDGGIKKLGFSDHAPQLYGDGYVSGIRMTPEEAYGYISDVRALAEEYKSDIEIFCGFEAEYFPSIFEKLRSFCRDNGVDYLILGQHCLTIEPSHRWVGAPSPNKEELTKYVDEVLEGLSTGAFSYLCHPDVFCYSGYDREFYMSENRRLCQGAAKLGIPMEINLHGLLEARHYPGDRFFELAREEGNTFILGIDAHDPREMNDLDNHRDGVRFATDNGITLLDDITFKKI